MAAVQNPCYVCNLMFVNQFLRQANYQPGCANVANIAQATGVLRAILAEHRKEFNELDQTEPIQEGQRICVNCLKRAKDCVELTRAGVARKLKGTMLSVVNNERNCGVCMEEPAAGDKATISIKAIAKIFVDTGKLLRRKSVFCAAHFSEDGRGSLFPLLYPSLTAVSSVPDPVLMVEVLRAVRTCHLRVVERRLGNCLEWPDDQFQAITGTTKLQFHEIIHEVYGQECPQDLAEDLCLYLMKFKHNCPDSLLATIFRNRSRQTISRTINEVTDVLLARYVPRHLGLQNITAAECAQRHNTEFARVLCNMPNAHYTAGEPTIVVMDSTYYNSEKSTNFDSLRRTWSTHKNRHLAKIFIACASDGYILHVSEPFFANYANNDASICRRVYEEGLRDWLNGQGITVFDRGFRDIVDQLIADGHRPLIPPHVGNAAEQLGTAEANHLRLVTKIRWICEANHGILKKKWKILNETFPMHSARRISSFYKVACAMRNHFFVPIIMNDDLGVAYAMRDAVLQNVNELQVELNDRGLNNRQGPWVPANQLNLEDFPQLELEQIRFRFTGGFQLKLSRSYIYDAAFQSENGVFEVSVVEPGLVKAKLRSRYRNNRLHYCWVQFGQGPLTPETQFNIRRTYCRCRIGARTVGSCSHVVATVWALCFALRQPAMEVPPEIINEHFRDAGDSEEDSDSGEED